mgnify:CR=1 FL=1
MRTEMLYVGESTPDVGEQTVGETTVIRYNIPLIKLNVNTKSQSKKKV